MHSSIPVQANTGIVANIDDCLFDKLIFGIAFEAVYTNNAMSTKTVPVRKTRSAKQKSVDKDKWNTSSKTQKKRLIKLLQEFIAQLEGEPVHIEFEYKDEIYKGEAVQISQTCDDGICSEFDVSINDEHVGIIKRMTHNWKIDGTKDQKFVDAIGEEIEKQNQ